MTRRKLLRNIDCAQVEAAIRKAEERTSGEICVSLSLLFWGNAQKAAENAFVRLGMTRTTKRNGVLLFVVPSRRELIIRGDRGIHEKVAPEFWQQVIAVVTEQFRAGEFTGGLVRGIEEIGQQLATHFPANAASDVNELPNNIDFGASPRQTVM